MQTTTKPDESTWTEARLQQECYLWHHQNYPAERGLLFTVDNNATDAIKGVVRKAVGRVAGVSDMIYLSPEGCPVLIEFKLPKGRQSVEQMAWQTLVERNHHYYRVIRSLAEFQELIQDKPYLPF
ncbi:VRR-NUC domain-containing protein [Spirosoma harenae]